METIKWGILGLGKIAKKFAEGLQYVKGAELCAVASSSQNRADEFAKQFAVSKAYNSYEQLVQDTDLDVIYIASYSSHHFEHSMLCLKNGKHVLCEKPLTTSVKETKKLIEFALSKNLFLMEALWTRFLPSIKYIENIVETEVYGKITNIAVSFGFEAPKNPDGRLLNPKLGGGALYDIGIYPLFLTQLLLGSPEKKSFDIEYDLNNIDIESTIKFIYKNAISEMKVSFKEKLKNEAYIYFEKATLKLQAMRHCPTKLFLIKDKNEEKINIQWIGNGYNYEAQHVTDALLNKDFNNPRMPHSLSICLIEEIEEML
jgi:predicted dehydrogenase